MDAHSICSVNLLTQFAHSICSVNNSFGRVAPVDCKEKRGERVSGENEGGGEESGEGMKKGYLHPLKNKTKNTLAKVMT